MDWLVFVAIVSSIIWVNTKLNEIDARIILLEKDIAVLKTVLIMKNIMPAELVYHKEEGGK